MHHRWFISWMSMWTCVVGLYASDETQLRLSRTHYDARERAAASMTFEWSATCILRNTEELIDRYNSLLLNQAIELGLEYKPIDKSIATNTIELNDYYIIERLPNTLRLRIYSETPFIDGSDKSLEMTDIYLKDGTIIHVHYDSRAQVASVDIFQSEEKDAMGLDSPKGFDNPFLRIFLGGVSPLRFQGALLDQWRLISASPEEWVFQLITQSEEQPQVTVHLDRRYQDCPAKLEIKYPDGDTKTWRTLKYKRIDGIWFPSEVELVAKTRLENVYTKYVLMKTAQTKEIKIDIPEGTPVRDWRKSGLKAWEFSGEDDAFERTTWSSTILQDNQVSSPKQ